MMVPVVGSWDGAMCLKVLYRRIALCWVIASSAGITDETCSPLGEFSITVQ